MFHPIEAKLGVITEDGAAIEAGLKEGDTVHAIDGKKWKLGQKLLRLSVKIQMKH